MLQTGRQIPMKQTMAIPDTRNQAWVDDKSKFGYKMLQKMGWTEGKGLGAKEDGATSHVRVRRKTTNVGVGGDTHLDAWNKPAQVASGLNAVLARLAPINCEKALVQKEKGSNKGRGYYERRSAGKNVGAYSANDLREIFGGINVDPHTEHEKQNVANGKSQKYTQDREDSVYNNVGSVETPDGTEDTRSLKSNYRVPKEKGKTSRKEKTKKAKRKSLPVEATIKKTRKSKKGKKRETR